MEMILITGRANPELANAIACHIGKRLGGTTIKPFADGELDVRILENVRRRHVVIIQPTPPPAENWLELIFLIDAARRASALEISVLMPYMGYARQDRKDAPRKPISAARMLKLLISSGASRILTIDLHAAQTQGSIDEPFDNFYFSAELLRALNHGNWKQTVLVSPDAGGMGRCRALAHKIGCPVAMIDKRRDRANESEVMNIVGDVRGRDAVLIDDMVDTAGSLVKAAIALQESGAKKVSACCTHAVLSPQSLQRLAEAPIHELVVSDTVPVSQEKCHAIGKKLKIVTCAPMLGRAILRLHDGKSLSVLFGESLKGLR